MHGISVKMNEKDLERLNDLIERVNNKSPKTRTKSTIIRALIASHKELRDEVLQKSVNQVLIQNFAIRDAVTV